MGTVIEFEDVRPGMTITLREGSLKLKGEVVRTRADLRNISFKTLGVPAAYYVSSDTVITTKVKVKVKYPEGTIIEAGLVGRNWDTPLTFVKIASINEWICITESDFFGCVYLSKSLADIKVVGGYVS